MVSLAIGHQDSPPAVRLSFADATVGWFDWLADLIEEWCSSRLEVDLIGNFSQSKSGAATSDNVRYVRLMAKNACFCGAKFYPVGDGQNYSSNLAESEGSLLNHRSKVSAVASGDVAESRPEYSVQSIQRNSGLVELSHDPDIEWSVSVRRRVRVCV